MNLKLRLAKLEEVNATRQYQQRGICIVGCGKGCSVSDDDFCKHEQQRLDEWIAEHDGKEPDEIIQIIGVSGPGG